MSQVVTASGELWLVRHGESDGADSADPGLSALGEQQVQALARRLADEPVASILHSPRHRARRTALALVEGRLGTPLVATASLDDRTPVPSSARRRDYPQELWPWLADVPAAGRDLDGRALGASVTELAELARAAAGFGPVVAVTHAFVIGWFVRSAVRAPVDAWVRLAPRNAALTVIRYSPDDAQLVAYNDTGHLR